MTFDIEEMKTNNTTVSVDLLGQGCGPMQFVRELTQKSIEAILSTKKPGNILWTYDKTYLKEFKVRKLCIIDNGRGMNGEELRLQMNEMFSSGKTQSRIDNYGIGAKVAALTQNPLGLVYQIWKDGEGYLGTLCEHPSGKYGLRQEPNDDGSTDSYIHIGSEFRPDYKHCKIQEHGCKVTLLGTEEDEDTFIAEGSSHGVNWLSRYLNSRYYKLPEDIDLKVIWHSQNNEDGTPKYLYRTIQGMEEYNRKYSTHSGTLDVKGAKMHWWVLDGDELKNERPEFPSTSQTASLYQDELYDFESKNKRNRSRLNRCGIVHLIGRVVIYAEPLGDIFSANAARTSLENKNGESIPWEDWADEFCNKMPKELQELEIEASIKASDSDLDKEIESMLKEWMRNYSIPKYKIEVDGELEISSPSDLGGNPPSGEGEDEQPDTGETPPIQDGGRGSRYSDFIKPKGEQGKQAKPLELFPK